MLFRSEASKERDRETDIEEANIRAVGAAVDNNAEQGELNNLLKILDQGIKKEDNETSRRRHRDESVTGVQTCALPIFFFFRPRN